MALTLQLDLYCTVRLEAAHLAVSYEARNQSGHDAGLFNFVEPAEPAKSPAVSPDNVYVDFDSGLLELLKQVLPVPGGMQVSSVPVPLVSKLPKGATFSEEFKVPLPARVHNPMRQMVLAAAHRGALIVAQIPAEAMDVKVCVGAFAVQGNMRFIEATAGAFRIWPPGPAVDGQFILSKTIRLRHPVPVLAFGVQEPKK